MLIETSDATVRLVIIFAFLVAGIVKGVIGMGLPTTAMGLLGLVMPPVQAAGILVIPSLVTNIWQLISGPNFLALLSRFALLLLCVCLGTYLGISLLTGGSAKKIAAGLGAVLAVYGVLGFFSLRFTVSRRSERVLSPLVGLCTGLLTGATGVFVIPAVPYFNSLGLEKDELIQALGLSFTISTIALGGCLLATGQFPEAAVEASLFALLPALAGMYFGQHLRKRLQSDEFRRWFFGGLLVLGVYMVLHL